MIVCVIEAGVAVTLGEFCKSPSEHGRAVHILGLNIGTREQPLNSVQLHWLTKAFEGYTAKLMTINLTSILRLNEQTKCKLSSV